MLPESVNFVCVNIVVIVAKKLRYNQMWFFECQSAKAVLARVEKR